jgi:hypothetical protein
MTAEVRNELMDWVQNLEDEELLSTLKRIKDSGSKGDWYEELSKEDQESIDRGVLDHQSRRVLTSEEFWQKNG